MITDCSNLFGNRIKGRRIHRDLSIRQVGKDLSIDPTYISKLENNKHNNIPSKEIIKKFSKYFDLDFEQMCIMASTIKPITNKRFNELNSEDDIEYLTMFYAILKHNKKSIKKFVKDLYETI